MNMRTVYYTLVGAVLFALCFEQMQAGGPWVQRTGKVRLSGGYSRKIAGSRWTRDSVNNKITDTPPDSTLVDGLFHDFRYGYISGEVGVAPGLEFSGTINYLWGYERVSRDPKTNKTVAPHWELNSGFTDMWLNLKYQFLEGDIPMAAMVSSRFPDLYDEPSVPYTRYQTRTFTNNQLVKTADGRDSIVKRTDTSVEATSEWRGLLKRDFGVHILAGHSFDGGGYVQAMLGYNMRQGAFADQLLFSVDGGYPIEITKGWTVMPKLLFDYTGGVGNGGVPDSSDRFQGRDSRGLPQANNYFNNGKYGRLYGSVTIGPSDGKYGLDLGLGRWIFGDGSAIYTETYAQFSYQF